jgi:hypothetical protein
VCDRVTRKIENLWSLFFIPGEWRLRKQKREKKNTQKEIKSHSFFFSSGEQCAENIMSKNKVNSRAFFMDLLEDGKINMKINVCLS